MTAYLIVYGATPFDRLAAYSFETREVARLSSVGDLTPRVPPDGPAGGCAYVIEREEDVTFSGRLLVDVFNALTESGVKKFESRQAGVKRLFACLPVVARPTNVPPTEEKSVSENDTPKARGRKMTEGKPANPEKFKPGRIRPNTDRHRVLAMMTGERTVDEIGQALGFGKPKYALAHFYCLARDCGVGYQIDAEQRVTAVYPVGASLETAVGEPVAKKGEAAQAA